MRKPLLVVCGVTTAVLIAGGIAATRAGADEAPDQPTVPGLQVPDLPTFPQMPPLGGPGTGDPVGATGADGQAAADGRPTADSQATAGDRATGNNDQAATGARATAGDPNGAGGHGQGATGDHQSTGDRDSSGDTGQTNIDDRFPDRPGGAHAATADRTPQRPGGTGAGQQQRASLTAAAQREVSPAQVSTSTVAPFQQQVLELINDNRRGGGCDPVTLDRRLILAAYGHAADMARRGYFAHESPNGDGAGDRVTDAGFEWSRYGENIARGPSSAYEVVDGWMHSPVHRENIMDCRFREMGIGLAFSSDKESYWVQDFATPRT